MKKLVILSLMLLASFITVNSQVRVDTASKERKELLVKFVGNSEDKDLLLKAKAKVKKKVQTKNMIRFNDPGFFVISVEDVQSALKEFKGSKNVVWAEPDLVVHHQGFSSDPLYGDLWGLNNIKAITAWNSGNKGKQEILVGIIDEGIMLHHEDLCGQIWVNPFEIPDNKIDDDGNGYIDDINGWDFKNKNNTIFDNSDNHGTHVAGTIGAIGDNNKGIIGIASSVKFISAKFLEGSGYISDGVEAIDYITDLKVRHNLPIPGTNNSWGGGYSAAIYDAINRARQADILFIAAAGNAAGNDNDLNPFYPASFDLDNIISVAAIDVNDQLASFSCYGKTTVDIGAPGVGIVSSVSGGPATSNYAFYNGTSMATPHVTGAVVLYKALNPSANYSQIKKAILDAARPIAALTGKTVTGGTLDVSTFTGNVTPPFVNGECTVPPLDVTSPTTPTNLRSMGIASPTEYKVKWDLSTDSSGIKMYILQSYDSVNTPILNYILNSYDNLVLGEGTIWLLTYGKTYRFKISAISPYFFLKISPKTIIFTIGRIRRGALPLPVRALTPGRPSL